MNKNKLAGLTVEELEAKKKQTKSAAWGFGIVLFIACCILLFLIVKKENYALLAIIPACWLTLLPIFIILGQLNAEIRLRKSKENLS